MAKKKATTKAKPEADPIETLIAGPAPEAIESAPPGPPGEPVDTGPELLGVAEIEIKYQRPPGGYCPASLSGIPLTPRQGAALKAITARIVTDGAWVDHTDKRNPQGKRADREVDAVRYLLDLAADQIENEVGELPAGLGL